MVQYECYLAPTQSGKTMHNFKVFLGDKVELFLADGRRQIGVVNAFRVDSIGLAGGSFIYLGNINDIHVLARGDGVTDWK